MLIAAIALALGCAGLALFALDIKSSRNDLLADDLDFNQRYLAWAREFPGTDDIIAVVDTTSADGSDRTNEAHKFIDALAVRVQNEESVRAAHHGAPASTFSLKSARLLPLGAFDEMLARTEDAVPMLESTTVSQLLGRTIRLLRDIERNANADPAQGIDQLTQLVDAVAAALRGDDAAIALARMEPSPQPSSTWQYLTSPNGRFLFMRIAPRIDEGSINAIGQTIAAVRADIDALKQQFPDVKAGLTGVEVIEADETDAATRDATFASIVALVAIAALLILAFRSVRTPMLLVITLIVGIAWSFGFLVLAIGYLQILSVIFVLVLLGLGIDFGIHFVSALEAARHDDASFAHALARAGRRSFPSITLGAVTTALAFGTTTFTDFRGIAELGMIAAGGIVLCLVATFTVLPALIAIFHKNIGVSSRSKPASTRPTANEALRTTLRSLAVIHTRPTLTLTVAGVFLIICAWYASHIEFDYDLMRLQPEGVESVEWQNTLLKEGGVSAWFAVSITDDLDEARVRSQQFAALPTVGEVGGIGMLFPPDEEAKLELIRMTRERMASLLLASRHDDLPLANADGEASALTSQLFAMRAMFEPQLGRPDLPADVRTSLIALGTSIDAAIDAASRLNPTTRNARVEALSTAYTALRIDTAHEIEQLLSDAPLTPADFPSEILRPYIDNSDPAHPRYAIEIHPRTPAGISNALDPTFLPTFVAQLKTVDPNVTGVLMQIFYTGSLMVRSYVFAGALAVVIVMVLLAVTLRSLYDAMLCIIPVALGFGAVLAAMDLTAHTLNAANIIVLPLMFGIGVDSGVHVIHRFRQHPTDRPLGLAHGTGKGITLTCLTTVIGFGTMLLARHRGIQSLGLVMSLGIALTLLACLIVLPALLEVRAKNAQSGR